MSTTAKLQGILTDVFPIETTPRFTKRVFWFKEPDTERYPQHWEVELVGEDVKQIMSVKIGDRIECEVEVRGRKYQKRDRSLAIFTTLRCVGIQLLERIQDQGTGYRPVKAGHDQEVEGKPQGELDLPM